MQEYLAYESKLKQYISENQIASEHIHFSASVHTMEEAAREAKASADDFVKSVCMISDNTTIIAIILGSDRADMSKIANLLAIKKPKVASPEELYTFFTLCTYSKNYL